LITLDENRSHAHEGDIEPKAHRGCRRSGDLLRRGPNICSVERIVLVGAHRRHALASMFDANPRCALEGRNVPRGRIERQ
jgi:hypothetical protein